MTNFDFYGTRLANLYLLIIGEKLTTTFSNILRLSCFLFVYYICVYVSSIYYIIEIVSVKFNFYHPVFFRLLVIDFFFTKIRLVYFLFYYYFGVITTQLKSLLIEHKLFLILNSLKKINQNFYYFSLNSHLRFITLNFKISTLYSQISKNPLFIAFIFFLIISFLVIKFFFLVIKIYRLFKIFLFFLKKNKKQTLEKKIFILLKPKNTNQLGLVLIEMSHIVFCFRTLSSFFYAI